MDQIVAAASADDFQAAEAITRDYLAFSMALEPDSASAPGFQGLQQELADLQGTAGGLAQQARQMGQRRLTLGCHITMTHAHAIYRAAGFADAPHLPDMPEHLKSRTVFRAMARPR